MNINQVLHISSGTLRAKKVKTGALDAEIALMHVLKKSREFLYSTPQKQLSAIQKKKFFAIIEKRLVGVPIAYLIQKKEFYGRDFYVNQSVLIPRPETETIIDEVLEYCKMSALSSPVIADIGTGSGCIAVTLALELPKSKVYATDVSKKALKVAQKNAKSLKVKVNFVQGSLLQPLKNKKINIIAANLPYGWNAWKNNSSADTIGLKFEPKQALFTTEGGLYLYRRFFEQLAKREQKPSLVLCEFDPRQIKAITGLIRKLLPAYRLTIKKDLAKLHRVAILEAKA